MIMIILIYFLIGIAAGLFLNILVDKEKNSEILEFEDEDIGLGPWILITIMWPMAIILFIYNYIYELTTNQDND